MATIINNEEVNSDETSVYKFIENHVQRLKMPNRKWMRIVKADRQIEFIRIEDDLTSYLAVSLNVELKVNVYFNKKLVTFIEWDKPQTENDVEKMLEIVDNCFVSRLMFFSDID